MNKQEIIWLASNEGRALLLEYKDTKVGDLPVLAQKLNKSGLVYASSLVTLLNLRQKAHGKFALADQLYFTPLGLEQSTSERIARYIARRFGAGKLIADLTCGIGANTIALAEKNQVLASDIEETVLACAELNAAAYGVAGNVTFKCVGAQSFADEKVEAIFIDPARDRQGKNKTRSLLNSRPDIVRLLPELFKITKNIGIKISPAFDYEELQLLPEQSEVELISEDSVVKVAMLWFGDFKTCERRATCMLEDGEYSLVDSACEELLSDPLKYLYEPDGAIIKARLLDPFACAQGMMRIDYNLPYLTSNELKSELRGICRIFEIIEQGEFNLKIIKSKIKELGIKRINIGGRGFPAKPEEIYKKLKIAEGGEWFLLCTIINKQKYFFLTKQLS